MKAKPLRPAQDSIEMDDFYDDDCDGPCKKSKLSDVDTLLVKVELLKTVRMDIFRIREAMLEEKQDQALRYLDEAARLEARLTFEVSIGKTSFTSASLSKLPPINSPAR